MRNRQWMLGTAGLFAAFTFAHGARGDEPPRPELHVTATEDFEVTGEGDAPAWQNVAWTEMQLRTGGTRDYQTRFKVLYSEKGLYFLMDGADEKLTATFDKDFANLWEEDVFEIFLWTDETIPLYFEYEISPLNSA